MLNRYLLACTKRATHALARSLAALALLLTGLLARPALAQTPEATFAPVVLVGNSPAQGIAVADVNGDGKPDALTANTGSNTVSVLLGNGSGGFTLASSPGTGAPPVKLAVADVNSDGKPDVLTANGTSNTVSVLLGSGTGSFTLRANSPATAPNDPLRDLAVADVNADGKLDVVTIGFYGTVSVLLGNGTGAFVLQPNPPNGGYNFSCASVAVADVNGDGKPDVLTANDPGNTVGVLLGNGSGGFTLTATISPGSGPRDVAVADMNADGKPDLLTANSGDGKVSVLLGTGTGAFNLQPNAADSGSSDGAFGVAVADVNGDGYPDALVNNVAIHTVAVLLGDGTGALVRQADLLLIGQNTNPWDIAVADVNGDGRPDALTVNNAGSIGVLMNTTGVPTLASFSPGSGPVGTTVTLTGTNFTGTTAVKFNGTAAPAFTIDNATTITVTVPAGASTGAITVTTPGGTATRGNFTVITDLVIDNAYGNVAPGIYNSITLRNGAYVFLDGDVVVNGFMLVQGENTRLDMSGAVLRGAGTFTLGAGTTLIVTDAAGLSASGATGSVQLTGTRSLSTDASYGYNTSAGMSQQTGTGLPAQVRALLNYNYPSLTLSQPLRIAQTLNLSNDGDLNTNGNALTLLSSASGTALVINSGASVVQGAVTVQRYIDGSLNAGAGYRHYSAPVANTTVADLATTGFTPVLTQSYNTSATPGTTTPFPTVFAYDQARQATATSNYSAFDKGWVVPASASVPLVPGKGYSVNIGASQLVDFVGTLNNGDLTVNLSRGTGPEAGWALLGNPYPSPFDVDITNVAARVLDNPDMPGLDAAFYVVQSAGPYTGQYRSFVNGVGNSVLPVGQGFFVRVSAGNAGGSFTFRNSQRVTDYGYGQTATFQRKTPDLRPRVQLDLAGAGRADTWVAYAEADATAAFDRRYDAAKLPNATGLNLASLTASEPLAIDGRAAFTPATSIALTVGVPAAGTYTLSAAALNNLPAGLDAYLRDAQTGTTTKLSQGSSYSFTVTAAQAAATLVGRFTLQFSPQQALATATGLSATDVTVYPNPARERFTVLVPAVAAATSVKAELLNTLGQVVRTQSAALPAAGATLTVETAGLSTGVYTLRLQAGASTIAKRVVIQ